MNPEYYALKLQNGETLVPSEKELDRLARDNARAIGTSMAVPPALRRLHRCGFDARPVRTDDGRNVKPWLEPAEPPVKRDYLAFLENLPGRRID